MAIGRVNTGGSGSGGTLTVTGIAGHTVTATKDGKTYTRKFNSGGVAVFKGLSTGTWTLTMTGDGQTATRTVDVNADYAVIITYFSATINVTYPAGSTCKATHTDGTVLNAPDTSGTWACVVPKSGTWTILAEDTSAGKSKSVDVSITTDGQSKSVTLSYLTYYYNKGDTCDSITGGWVKAGNGGSLTFNSESMTLIANTNQVGTDAVTTNMISLANIKTLYFKVKSATSYPTPGYPRVGIATKTNNPSSGASNSSKWTAFSGLSASSEFQTVSIDVSKCTESYYIAFGGYRGDSGGATIEVEAIWGDDQ